MKTKSYPVGQGNHNNIHYIFRGNFFIFKLCGFPDTEKIYIMSSSIKIDKRLINSDVLISDMKKNLLAKWGLELVVNDSELFDLRFDNTASLLESDYYKKSL